MKTEDFNFDLPQKFIAQTPVQPRHNSRLLLLNRSSKIISHSRFSQIGDFLFPGDLLVVNKTRVIPARIFGKKIPTGGKVELLLLRKVEQNEWLCIVGGKGINQGTNVQITEGPFAIIDKNLNGSQRLVRFSEPIEPFLFQAGNIPLPPYIHEKLEDPERYQTVFSEIPGSAAAPTAGLHFSNELVNSLKHQGIRFTHVTLHIGLDTFLPVHESDPKKHKIHMEWCNVSKITAELINQTHKSGGRVIAVGTTTVRAIETAALHNSAESIESFSGDTNLFILPGFKFKVTDGLITNFHLPKSTLLMLVSAFAGKDVIMNAYEVAKEENYRFFSFGDAMFIF